MAGEVSVTGGRSAVIKDVAIYPVVCSCGRIAALLASRLFLAA